MKDQFNHVRSWVFDLDNTLYPPTARLFDQMDERMRAWIVREIGISTDAAQELSQGYLAKYGTTLAGLMRHNDIDAASFLLETHTLDLSHMLPVPDLRTQIESLPGRKIVFTNGSRHHADKVTEALGLTGAFDAHYGIEDAKYVSKPHPEAFDLVFSAEGLTPENSAMFEDMAENLQIPHALGMQTVLVSPEPVAKLNHVHHVTDDLARFLSRINGVDHDAD